MFNISNRCGSDQSARDVVVKRALPHLLTIERNILEVADGYNCIRQLIHYIEDPPSLVLEYLDDNTLEVSRRDRLESTNLKFVARTLLEALAALHEKGYVHTGKLVIQHLIELDLNA